MNSIDKIIAKNSEISDIIKHDYKIYCIIKSYIDGVMSYDELRNTNLQFIQHDLIEFNIELIYHKRKILGIFLRLSIDDETFTYQQNCPPDILCDEILLYCKGLRKLYAHNNQKITTCDPFAETLEDLDASWFCGIGDKGLKNCHNIKSLDACGNTLITTCEPFAKTLEVLNVTEECPMTDEGIKNCHNLIKLYADNNKYITTCEPFAETLEVLWAQNVDVYHNKCGITDDGIKNCHNLKELEYEGNPKITRNDRRNIISKI